MRDLSEFRVLIVPGLHNSGPDHWQTHWQTRNPVFERVEQTQWNVPQLDVWSDRVGEVLRRSTQPTLVVAHSFGCLATLHRASLDARAISGALLVAPADPAKFGVAEQLHNAALPFPSIMVGSTNDPWMQMSRLIVWAKMWRSELIDAGALGHINAESGLGDWPFGFTQLQKLVVRVKDFEHRKNDTEFGCHQDEIFPS